MKVERDERSAVNQGRRKFYRYPGPGARTRAKVIEKVTGQPAPDIRFFNMGVVHDRRPSTCARCATAWSGSRAGRSSARGKTARTCENAIVEAGQEFGIRQVGARTYPTSCLESGWIPSPLPAVYTGDAMKAYRQWLKGTSYEAMASLGGSFYSERHRRLLPDAVRSRLRAVREVRPRLRRPRARSRRWPRTRRARRSRWSGTATTWSGRWASLFHDRGDIAKYIDLPLANYSTLPYDKVVSGGKTIGLSTYTGYNFNERAMLSLAILDNEQSEPGTRGDAGVGRGGRRHRRSRRSSGTSQAEIRATVQPAPISEVARVAYRPQGESGRNVAGGLREHMIKVIDIAEQDEGVRPRKGA